MSIGSRDQTANPTFGTATAPASFTLTANAADSDGMIAKVEFYQGTTLLGTVTASPYSYPWNNVAAGSYSLTAVATDNYGVQTTSAAVSVTVNSGVAQAYYIHTDQLDTPRVITDTNGNVVWRWDNADPFGANMANENPNGAGTFNFNLRFPGQYYDRETNLHYNVNRDYDPTIGRYVQSDPIGLGGGINTYTYVGENPLSLIDPYGESWREYVIKGGIWTIQNWKKISKAASAAYAMYKVNHAAEASEKAREELDIARNAYYDCEQKGASCNCDVERKRFENAQDLVTSTAFDFGKALADAFPNKLPIGANGEVRRPGP